MTQDRATTDCEHRRHPSRFLAQQRVPGRVDATVDRKQGTPRKPALHLIRGDPAGQKLPPSNHTVLALCQPRNHKIRGQAGTHVTLGAYIALNVARVGASYGLRIHGPHAAGP